MSVEHPDLVVIGGGIVGLSVAYEATRAGWSVLVLERAERIGAGAAGTAAGMLSPAAEADTGDRWLHVLATESCALYPEFVRAIEADSGYPCGYRTEGSLLVALNRDQAEELERLAAFQRRFGVETTWLTATEVIEREPALSPRVIGGLWAPGDLQVDPRRLMQSLALALVSRGGEIRTGVTAVEVATEGGALAGVRCTMDGEEQFTPAERVVVAAGAWATQIAGPGFKQIPLRPIKGQLLRLRGAPLIDHIVRTPEVYLVPRADGELVVGATAEEQGFSSTATAGAVRQLLTEAWSVLPGVEELEVSELCASLRPALRDHLPCIGPARVPGLFFAIGHYRHGVMLAPITARLLMETMRGEPTPSLLLPFLPARFSLAMVGGR